MRVDQPTCYNPLMTDNQFIDLRKAMCEQRDRLQEQLRACESGKFTLFWIKDGKRADVTDTQIADIKRIIAMYDSLITTSG